MCSHVPQPLFGCLLAGDIVTDDQQFEARLVIALRTDLQLKPEQAGMRRDTHLDVA